MFQVHKFHTNKPNPNQGRLIIFNYKNFISWDNVNSLSRHNKTLELCNLEDFLEKILTKRVFRASE